MSIHTRQAVRFLATGQRRLEQRGIWGRGHRYDARHHLLRADPITREMPALGSSVAPQNQAGRRVFVVERGEHYYISMSRSRSVAHRVCRGAPSLRKVLATFWRKNGISDG